MKDIDKYAYYSSLRLVCPKQKTFLAILNLCIALWTESVFLLTLIFFLMSYITIFKGKTPSVLYLKFLCIPFSFLILSLVAIIVEWGNTDTPFLYSLILGNIKIGITQTGLLTSQLLFFRVMTSISCLYFLCLSTPMVDLLLVFRGLGLPSILIELMSLIYRFIFILIDTAYTMQVAQSARLGYTNFKVSIKSLGMLFSTLLLRSLKSNEQIYTALESRGYTGNLNVLNDILYTHIKSPQLLILELSFILLLLVDKGWI